MPRYYQPVDQSVFQPWLEQFLGKDYWSKANVLKRDWERRERQRRYWRKAIEIYTEPIEKPVEQLNKKAIETMINNKTRKLSSDMAILENKFNAILDTTRKADKPAKINKRHNPKKVNVGW